MVLEIWSMTDRIFSHFGPFFALLPPNNPENQNFEKMKKMPGDIIISHKCSINDNHMMYNSWDMKCDRRQNKLFIKWNISFLFFSNAANSPNNQNFLKMKKKKKHMEISSFYIYMCTKNYDQMMYGSWDMVRDRWMDRWTDRQKKWHIQVDVPPNNCFGELAVPKLL